MVGVLVVFVALALGLVSVAAAAPSLASEFVLPDHRAWEVVSPSQKDGSTALPVTYAGGVVQAAENGGAVAYMASGPFAEAAPEGNVAPGDAQILSVRGPGGWSSKDLATPHRIGTIPVGVGFEYKFFSTDLSSALLEPLGESLLPAPSKSQTQEQTLYLRSGAGSIQALVDEANVMPGASLGTVGEAASYLDFETATPDLHHVIFSSNHLLTDEPGIAPSATRGRNLYEWSGNPGENGTVRLASIAPSVTGREEGSAISGSENSHAISRDALSRDGSRVIWTEITGGLYLTDLSKAETALVSYTDRGSVARETIYEGANPDATKVFFTSRLPLLAGADQSHGREGEGDLYVYESPRGSGPLRGTLRDLTANHHLVNGEREETSVLGNVIGYGGEGSGASESFSVYFVDAGVLAENPGALGRTAAPGQPNLYLERFAAGSWQAPRFVASLSLRDAPTWDSPQEGGLLTLPHLTSGVSGNGRFVAFMSSDSLTGYDNTDAVSGAPDQEVFLYDSVTGKLVCASCNPSGARPHGVLDERTAGRPPLLVDEPLTWSGEKAAPNWLAGSLPGWTPTVSVSVSLYHPRYLTNSGRLFFTSPDALVPGDTNGLEDVYEYEPEGVGSCAGDTSSQSEVFWRQEGIGGCVGLISSGTSSSESAFLDASGVGPGGEEGEDVFFLTDAQLVGSDTDTAFDVYDAHVCSGVSPCLGGAASVGPACSDTDSCRAAAAVQPGVFGVPSSETFSGVGNVAASSGGAVHGSVLTRAQLLARALRACQLRHGKRRRAACRAAARRRYGPRAVKQAGRRGR